jgi:hypothetical protein
MLKRSVWKALNCGVLIFFAALVCRASTIQYQADITGGSPNFNTIATVTAFNSQLGTLNSITITIDGAATSDIGLKTANSNVVAWGYVGATERAYVPGLGPDADGIGGVVVAMVLPRYVIGTGVNDGTALTPNVWWHPSPNPITSNDTQSGDVASEYFSRYVYDGPGGTVDIPFRATAAITYSVNTGSLSTDTSVLAGGRVTVTYDYTDRPVPEPITLVLLGSGLFLMGMLGRKRVSR